ncbi:hypothetical protein Tco_0174455 [Tanacetum coccineum]
MSSLSTPTNPLTKPPKKWLPKDRKLANLDKRLRSIIISCLPNDVMKAIIKCATTQSMWNDFILAHEGFSDIRDTKIATLRLKFNAFKALKGKNEFLADLNAEFHERALLANQKRFYKRYRKGASAKKTIDKSNETWDKGTTKVKAFIAIAEEKPFVGKANRRSGQWALGGRAPDITFDFEFVCDTEEPVPLLPKLIGGDLTSTSNNLIDISS